MEVIYNASSFPIYGMLILSTNGHLFNQQSTKPQS